MLILFLLAFTLCAAQNAPPTSSTTWTEIRQSDFDQGTLRITQPGYYRLVEDIWFNTRAPLSGQQAYDAYLMDPTRDFTSVGGAYDDDCYRVGFWAAITIETSKVTIDLAGKTIGQAPGHNLMNRFFHVINLGSHPFYSHGGFHDFLGDNKTEADQVWASQVTIQNGRIGRSASAGISGYLNQNIYVTGVDFVDQEGVALQFSGATTLILENVNIQSAQRVAVNSLWRTAIQLREYVEHLLLIAPTLTIDVRGIPTPITVTSQTFRETINTVYDRVVTRGGLLDRVAGLEDVNALFANDFALPDANCAGVSIAGLQEVGNANFTFSTLVNISNVHVRELNCAPLEIVAVAASQVTVDDTTTRTPLRDPRGNVFSIFTHDWDFTVDISRDGNEERFLNAPWTTISLSNPTDLGTAQYTGNLISTAQALVGKAILDGILKSDNSAKLDIVRNTMNADIITWISATPGSTDAALSTYMRVGTPDFNDERHFICNCDNTGSPFIGNMAFSIFHTKDITIQGSGIHGLRNYGPRGSGICVYNVFSKSNPDSFFSGYSGCDVRGFIFVNVTNFNAIYNFIENVESYYGSLTNWDMIESTNGGYLNLNEIKVARAGTRVNSQEPYLNNPTTFPVAIGFRTTKLTSHIVLDSYCVNDLESPFDNALKVSLSSDTVDNGEWETCHLGEYPWWIWFLLAIVSLIFIIAVICVILACLDVGGEKEGEYYTQMNDN